MKPAFYEFRHFFHTVELSLCVVCFKPFFCSHEKVPAPLSHEETEHKYERGIKDVFSEMYSTMAQPKKN